MATITRIVQQKDKNRANIYLDGKFAFGISLGSLFKHGLEIGGQLDLHTIDRLKREDSKERIWGKAVRFATLRPRSQREIKDWFKRKKVNTNVAKVVFNRLNKLGVVNEEKFARWWVGQRTIFRYYSRKHILFELRQKGIKKDLIDEVLETAEVPPELELAKVVLVKKFKNLSGLREQQLQKVYAFLARRGFSYSTIKRAVDETKNGE